MSSSDETDSTRLPRPELRRLQDRRIREVVRHAYENVAFYRRTLDEAGVSPEDVTSVDDLSKLPFTTKEDFRDEYPTGMFAVDMDDVIRIHASSGTTGKPKIVGYTRDDLDIWREMMARGFRGVGLTSDDSLQNAYSYGLFTGGFGFHDGATEMGLSVVPTGGGNTQRQVEMLADLGTDAICLTPSYALYLAEVAEEMGYDPADLPLSVILYGAEPCTEPMRNEIETRFDATAVENYGLSEIIGPGVAVECLEQAGMHIWEDHFYPEVIDPNTGEQVEEGEEGELVLTTLTKVALPVLRYRTGDLTTLDYDTCECGRTCVRMSGVTGRADDLLIVRGVNFYPSEVESVVLEFDEIAPHYRIDLRRDGNLDRLDLTVELAEDFDGSRNGLERRIRKRLSNVLGFTPDEIVLVSAGSIERTKVGKVQRVYDHR
ncbi:phenylacetate--CoA ligase (plasmid) [Haloferax mediterranei ATCC 33500]|uniref:Phenylacetate--CoA ligase n=1 Tax=Haloferax mediterranei (strain ATCC 33500 / DSM 1411 / JCM 8866 / NBRC 14739 / NCIMB 2177 / R-4) TaxID=523841 RepID=I3RB82_HALMT|nr:phenylacetate--CoA ligase PaaK [Haloferax mediterranei]AFK21492.1 phenylacetyl-coenzyme A ligase [Haloferax mediterranei ATCC 33500]AHZ24450.1 phenylacetate--CoA ligase [Haloferax mediterranei ATCC 33500]ELZ97196.1 phenylacetyl-coenzyme A ligase [Haloferax mediterranei ATCC 33500]MDX5990066.1 phenylacetate--CoA ligase PaaK [Haloferax mediterranei ATCC 33500]QCQ76848.1 phenylacetate--CoA ligase [Haloferax mediterranei ATCC 33500]